MSNRNSNIPTSLSLVKPRRAELYQLQEKKAAFLLNAIKINSIGTKITPEQEKK